jgi:predicted  nucleic acid-binding Zn-ribbon protein
VDNNKKNIIIDIKTIVIILNNSDKEIEKYQQEITNLNTKNKELLLYNDSLENLNLLLSNDVTNLNNKIDDINLKLISNEGLIRRLKNKKGEILTNVNVMDADGVASGISDYLKRRN